MATRNFIEMAQGDPIENTEREIDSSIVDENGKAPISIQPVT
jgi:hypothetical protein